MAGRKALFASHLSTSLLGSYLECFRFRRARLRSDFLFQAGLQERVIESV